MVNENPVVSIITPSFNRADIVHETADSIFRQTYPYWEWVIVDDGSTDNSMEVLQQYVAQDKRVRVFQRDRQPKGACACRNIAVEKCSGDYVMFLDTDDLVASYCLQQRVEAARKNRECDFIIFPMLMFKTMPDDMGVLWNVDNNEDELNRLLFGDPVCQGTGTLWKKQSFIDIGMWNEALLLWQDIELHLRSFVRGVSYRKRMDLLPDVFLRISEVSLSRTGYHSLPKLQSRIKVFTDTASAIESSQKMVKYKEGLRYMGSDLVVSAAKSSFFDEAGKMAEWCIEKGIFTLAETKQLLKYIRFRSLKLYRIPLFGNMFLDSLQTITPHRDNNVGKIKYSQPIQY
jgi:hypothetical protein